MTMSDDNRAVLLQVLAPLYSTAPAGESKMVAYLATDAGLASATELVAAVGLVSVAADGSVSVATPAEAAAEGARCADPLVAVTNTVSGSLKAALQKQVDAAAADAAPKELVVGMKCVRSNCGAEYDGSGTQQCKHCPGAPVFHEGFKYWSCCDSQKTLDFETFLNMKGCEDLPECKWFKDVAAEGAEVEEKQCRVDWYETPGDVVVEIFAKCVDPDQTSVKINGDTLEVDTLYEQNKKFTMHKDLAGTIDTSSAKVTLFSTKINIKLKKSEGGKWGSLEVGGEAKE